MRNRSFIIFGWQWWISRSLWSKGSLESKVIDQFLDFFAKSPSFSANRAPILIKFVGHILQYDGSCILASVEQNAAATDIVNLSAMCLSYSIEDFYCFELQIEELNLPHVHIKDREKVEQLISTMIDGGRDKLQVID